MCVVDNGFTCAGVFAHTRQVLRGSCVVSACTFDSALHWLVADNAGAQGGQAQYFHTSPRWSCPSPLRCISRSHTRPRPHSRGQWRHSHLPRAPACAGTASHWARRASQARPREAFGGVCMLCTVGCGGQSDRDKFTCNRSLSMLRCCLLYTSPSPRDVEESRMPSSA